MHRDRQSTLNHHQGVNIYMGKHHSAKRKTCCHHYMGHSFPLAPRVLLNTAISRSSQCSTTGVTKAMVCVIMSVG